MHPVLLSCALALAQPSTQEVVLRHLVTTGDPAPGAPAGAYFAQFGTIPGIGSDFAPDVDAAGEIAFHALLAGAGISGPSQVDGNALGIWRTAGATLHVVARQDQPAPGTAPGVEFLGFPSPLVSAPPVAATGTVAYVGGLRGPGVDTTYFSNASGIWTDSSGTAALVARAGDAAPGSAPGATFRAFGLPFVNPSGELAFHALWRASGDSPGLIVEGQEGFWSTRGGTLSAVLLAGSAAPGTEPGVTFGEGTPTAIGGAFRAWDTRDELDLALHGNLAGPGISDTDDEGVWVEAGGGLTLVAREGAPAPGAGAGVRFGISTGIDAFGELVGIRRGASGATLFGARLSAPGVPFLRSVWVHRAGASTLVARSSSAGSGTAGDPAPGLPAGWTFDAIQAAEIDGTGRVAFRGTATFQQSTSQLRQGLWREQGNALAALALEGQPAPDLPGLTFAAFGPLLTSAGDGALAYSATVAGAGVGSHNDVALFLVDAAGDQRRVVREGDSIDLEGGPRIVSRLIVGRIDASGILPLELEFTDGASALFTASFAAPDLVEICAGDGSAAACPCGNESASGSGEGCRNSTGAGAKLLAAGTTRVASDDLRFDVDGLAPLRSALLYAGTGAVSGGTGAPFGDGLRCASGAIRRLGLRVADASGAASWGPGLASLGAWSAGDVRIFQVWYRDGAGPCDSGFNLSDAWRATFVP